MALVLVLLGMGHADLHQWQRGSYKETRDTILRNRSKESKSTRPRPTAVGEDWALGDLEITDDDEVDFLLLGRSKDGTPILLGEGWAFGPSESADTYPSDLPQLASNGQIAAVFWMTLLEPDVGLEVDAIGLGDRLNWDLIANARATIIDGGVAEAIWRAWYDHVDVVDPAAVAEREQVFVEGARLVASSVRYERDPRARSACIAHHGSMCVVCGLDPVSLYGKEIGPSVIQAHHVIPLHYSHGEPVLVDPRVDMRPLCPSCHVAIHRLDPVPTPEEFRDLLRHNSD